MNKLCNQFPVLSTSTDVIGVLLVVGTQLSYVPQIVEIVRKRSSFGVSVLSRLTFQLMITCQCMAIFALQWRRLQCCSVWGATLCYKALLEQGQLYLIFLNISLLFLLVLAYHERGDNTGTANKSNAAAEYRRAWRMGAGALLFAGVAIGGLALVLVGPGVGVHDTVYAESYSVAMGIGAGILQAVANLPQIYKTWRLKRVGSVSILTNFIQGLGGILQFYFQLENGLNEVQIWGPVLANALSQSLLAMELLYFMLRERRLSKTNNTKINITAADRHPSIINKPLIDHHLT